MDQARTAIGRIQHEFVGSVTSFLEPTYNIIMEFPEYKLANFQASAASRTKHVMGASAPQHCSLQELLAIASEEECNQWHEFSLGYTPSQGSPDLRDQIAKLYHGLTADNVVVFAGALEAIYTVYHALLSAEDKVQVATPIFEPLAILPQAIGAQVCKIKMRIEDNLWQLDLDEWLGGIRPDTALATINFPHNPTGAMISKLQLEMMIDACRANDTWLFSDEVFRGLEYRDQDRLPPVATLYEKGISLGVMSKAFGLGGVRIGWIACQDKDLIKRMLQIKSFLSICNGRADEILTMIALNHAGTMRENTRKLLLNNLDYINQKLEAVSDKISWYQPQAGCIAYPKLSFPWRWESSQDFAENMLDDMGILVTPGNCFLQAEDHFRLGFGRKDFPETFDKFINYL